jgi:hypothetical protein
VFSLPLNSGVAEELTGPPLSLGTLAAESALNVKLAEDILIPLGIPTPYITDGGNLVVELTIEAADVRGAAQVFSDNFGFGTYPLEVISDSSSEAFEVLDNTVLIEVIREPDEMFPATVVRVSGVVRNRDFQDAVSVDVAIATFDSNGKMIGGNTTSVSSTPRKRDGVVRNNGLLKGHIGYFHSILTVSGTVESAKFFVSAERLATSPPLAQPHVTSHTITEGDPFLLAPGRVIRPPVVDGTIRNGGTVTAELISVYVIFMDSQGRVIGVSSVAPEQSTLPPGASSTFSAAHAGEFDPGISVVFSFDWLEE